MSGSRRFLMGSVSTVSDPSTILGAELRAWYDASDTSTITDAGGGAVSAWNDKSGNGYNWGQSTSGNRPTTGTRTHNSLNVIDFDGFNDHMTAAHFNAIGNCEAMWAVAKQDAATFEVLWSEGRTSSDNGWQGFNMRGGSSYIGHSCENNSAANQWDLDTARVGTTAFRCTFKRTGTTGTIDATVYDDVGGTETRSAFTMSAYTANTTAVGCLRRTSELYFWDGWIGELIFADSPTAGQITEIDDYLDDKWNF